MNNTSICALRTGAQVFVAFVDGTMCGCSVNQRMLQSVWHVSLGEAHCVLPCLRRYRVQNVRNSIRKALDVDLSHGRRCGNVQAKCDCAEENTPLQGTRVPAMRSASIIAEPHPLIKGAALLVACTSAGFVSAWELTDTKCLLNSSWLQWFIEWSHLLWRSDLPVCVPEMPASCSRSFAVCTYETCRCIGAISGSSKPVVQYASPGAPLALQESSWSRKDIVLWAQEFSW